MFFIGFAAGVVVGSFFVPRATLVDLWGKAKVYANKVVSK